MFSNKKTLFVAVYETEIETQGGKNMETFSIEYGAPNHNYSENYHL